jgi:hypothetical protein
MNLYKEAKELAQEAWEQSEHDIDEAMDFLHQSCDGHEVAIYYGKAIDFCANQDTSDGEDWLEDCESLIQKGDTFGSIACRIAFATLLVKSQEALQEIHEESDL